MNLVKKMNDQLIALIHQANPWLTDQTASISTRGYIFASKQINDFGRMG